MWQEEQANTRTSFNLDQEKLQEARYSGLRRGLGSEQQIRIDFF